MRSALRWVSLATAAVIILSCFEPPVAEDLRLEFSADGLVTITALTRIRDVDESNAALQRRIEEARRAAFEGTDAWSGRFEAFGPTIERGEWEKHEGRLVSHSHSATSEDPQALSRFFADTGLVIEWRLADGRGELALYPPAAGNAGRAERQRVGRALDDWSAELAAYLASAEPLWRHLEANPDRARPCFAHLFSTYIAEQEVEATGELSAEEAGMVEELSDAIDQVTTILSVPEGEAYSLDELSRRVYDPFPAPLTVRVPGEILELEGFTTGGDGGSDLHAGGTSLWQALRGIEGRWLSPDPAVALVAHDIARSPGQSFPLAAFLSRPRQAETAPSAHEARRALAEHLAPAPAYRLVWSQPQSQDEGEQPPTADGPTANRPSTPAPHPDGRRAR